MTDHQPNDLEDRIRDAYQSAARTVQTLQQTSPVLAAGSVRRPRRMNAFAPIAAAMAVIVVIAASVALPRLLTGAVGSSPNPAVPGISAPGHYPPFQVVVTVKNNLDSRLLVESAATGHVVTSVAPPWRGAVWGAVAAVGDAGRFIVAAAPKSPPWTPTRLYSLTLSARGTVAGLTPLPVPALPGQLTSLAASADGRTIAYTLFAGPGGANEVGVITGRRTRQWQWSIPSTGRTGISLIWGVSVSSDGSMVAFITQSDDQNGLEDTAWVLPTGSAPGGITARARKMYEHPPMASPTTAGDLDSALISPDGSTLYLATNATSASGKAMTALTAYRTAGGASPGTITTWDGDGFHNGFREIVMPVGGMLLAWNLYSSTAYLINPATRTRTTLPLRGIPRVQSGTGLHVLNVHLAW